MGYKHCSRMRRLLGIPDDAYDHFKDDLHSDRPPLNPSQQSLTDVVEAYQRASERVNRNHGKILIKNEIVKVEPMSMPDSFLLLLDWKSKDD